MLYIDRYTNMPELYGMLGLDTFKSFIDVFGGTTIRIPSRSELTIIARDVHIYKVLISDDRDKGQDYGHAVRTLAGQYSLSEPRVRQIAAEVGKKLHGLEKRQDDWVERLASEAEIQEGLCE
jgi:hypothetical protein